MVDQKLNSKISKFTLLPAKQQDLDNFLESFGSFYANKESFMDSVSEVESLEYIIDKLLLTNIFNFSIPNERMPKNNMYTYK